MDERAGRIETPQECVQFFDNFKVRRIIELNWDQILQHKRWHSRMRAWNLGTSMKPISDARILVENKEVEQSDGAYGERADGSPKLSRSVSLTKGKPSCGTHMSLKT